MLRLAIRLIAVAAVALTALPALAQSGIDTRARHAILIDYDTNSTLFAKDADIAMPPASMAKLMTAAVIFSALKDGRLSLDQEFTVSENAWRTGGAPSGGSTMFAKLGSSIRVDDLLHGIIIQSANDGCIIVAEGMAGSEADFAAMMNAEAARIGLTGSHFVNSTGLPDPNQVVTARDLAKLARHIITTYPEFYPIYSQPAFTWNDITQRNRNPLLDMNIGADGMKTGYTEESGYGLVGTTVRNGQRLIVVVNGTETDKDRGEEARRILEWGYRAFTKVKLFAANEVIADARVFHGDSSGVGLVSHNVVDVLLPIDFEGQLRGRIVYRGPIPAPVTAGQEIGTLEITVDDAVVREAPVYAASDIGPGGIPQRALDGVRELLLGWW